MIHLLEKPFAAGFALALFSLALPGAEVPVVTQSNLVVRIMAANLTSGSKQRYEDPGLRIFQGLKPDVVAIQEFNFASTNGNGTNTANAFREMVNSAFGTNYTWFRETNPSGGAYNIPNGIISRWPIRAAGSWVDDDTGVNDRGFAWARIGLPGSNDLYVVSIHLKANASDTARRGAEALQLKGLIQSSNWSGGLLAVAGDCNIASAGEPALATFNTYLTDTRMPTDTHADPDTNAGRDERYDYVFTSSSLDALHVPCVLGAQSFANGLVFDSRTFAPLGAVSPVVATDSGATGMQHMGVMHDFRITFSVTNMVAMPRPQLQILKTNVIRWPGVSNLVYHVQTSSTLSNWIAAGTATSAGTNFFFTNSVLATNRLFYRVVYP
ncbi:MAG: hypothetical protein QOF48_954 [Verrucomicrobiota bacterium]|jgi:endonuclease/exonuclease/phosphatase family metal-dependent hydrolase